MTFQRGAPLPDTPHKSVQDNIFASSIAEDERAINKCMEKPSIAIITSQAFSLVNFRGALIRHLVSEGARVYAFAPDYTDRMKTSVSGLGAIPVDYSSQRARIQPWRDTLRAALLAAKLRTIKPQIVLSYFIKPVIFGTLAGWIAGVPRRIALVEGLGYVFVPDPENSWKKSFVKTMAILLYRLGLSRAHRVLFLNEDDRSEFIERRMVAPEKTEMIGGIGVDLDQFAVSQAPTQPVTFVFVGRLLKEKGLVEFVSAARIVKAKCSESRFLVLGDVDANPGSVRLSQLNDWVNEGLIEWPGHVEVHSWLMMSSVFVLPSYYREGVPRSTQEAMALGRPVITTDMPGCKETVEDGVNGFIVPPRNPQVLSEAMMRFVVEPQLISIMGRESRRIAEARFDEKTSVRTLTGILLGRPITTAHDLNAFSAVSPN
jgi:glycosyltransferase involved in cell wall biosynthesis